MLSVACILTKSDFPLERADRILARAIEIDCNRLTAARERGPEVIAMESKSSARREINAPKPKFQQNGSDSYDYITKG